MKLEDLSCELLEKVKACSSVEELEALCAEEGIKLSDDELNAVAGGIDCSPFSGCKIACSMHIPPCPGATF